MTNSSIGSTTSYNLSTFAQIGSMDRLCAANATWKSAAVTVGGSSNGVSSSSLAGLNNPVDMLIDTRGNLLITDCNNYRVVYWPVNATEGQMIVGTGAFSSWINSFKCAAGLVGKKMV